MKRDKLIVSVVALVSLLTGILIFQLFNSDSTPPPKDSLELTAIPLTSLTAEQSTIGDLRGQILVVNFWAPWCLPCRREIPTLIQLNQSHSSQNVAILGIALDSEDAVSRFAEEYKIDYPLFLAGNRISMYNAAFGNPSGSLPFTAIIDQQQRIVFRHNGEVSGTQLRDELQKLL